MRTRRHRNPAITSRIMSAVKCRDSKAERTLAKAMWQLGLRYRKQPPGIAGKPDFAFLGQHVAVFCDGDFWHGKGWRARGFHSWSAQFKDIHNGCLWKKKIAANMARDRAVNKELRRAGWKVIRCMETVILRDPLVCAARIRRMVSASRRESPSVTLPS